jgi:hypothetical protein
MLIFFRALSTKGLQGKYSLLERLCRGKARNSTRLDR